jgi:hypothetical protein
MTATRFDSRAVSPIHFTQCDRAILFDRQRRYSSDLLARLGIANHHIALALSRAAPIPLYPMKVLQR